MHKIVFGLLCLLPIVTGCNTKKYLQDGDVLLHKNRVEVMGDLPSAARNTIRYELEKLLLQEPNDKALIFFKPRLYFYYRQQEKQDTTDFDRFVQTKLMEPPSLYDDQLTESSRRAMYDHLYRKGYLDAQVWVEDQVKGKKAEVKYYARLNQLYTIDTFELAFVNTDLAHLVDSLGGESHLRRGAALSLSNLNAEKQRIVELLHNQGYADFSYSNFDLLEVSDTTDATVNARLRILRATDSKLEAKTIGNINVYNRSESLDLTTEPHISMHDSVAFVNFNNRNSIRPSAILRYLPFRPGDKLDKSVINKARAQLQLPAVKFANPRLVPREDNPNVVDIEIDLIRERKISVETNYQLSQNRVNSQALLGLTGSINARNNNIFGGSELLSNDLIGSVELAPRNRGIFNAINVNFNNSLEFPRFVDFLGIYKLMRRLGILKQERLESLIGTGTSIFNARYEYVDLINFYNYQSIDLDFGFRSTTSNLRTRKQIQITHPSITYFNPETRDSFNFLYPEGTFARRSFAPQFFTSLLFNELTYIVEHAADIRGISSAFITQLELSGLEAYLVNAIVNGLSEPLKIGNLSFAQFARLDLDGRLYKQLNRDQSLAFRGNIGVAVPFGTSDDIPYVRQFFLGGPNTIRAWKIRELGPGSHLDQTITRQDNLPFFQAADLKLLLNAEYRFDVFWRLEGAVFLDAGNIWSLSQDERDGGRFGSDFLSQMAVGSGFGIRFDADYFRIVLDVGVKVRNPYEDEQGRHAALGVGLPFNEVTNLNFAINYPF
ncbi:MAG: outer membrane protein assembly factor [Saprospiraceae bacterium]|nr:outer membrane protein assembly factor [Saprospiraceae bacterium]